ncbi:MAG: porin, Gram-negative type [Rhodoferax sp.]|nr:porin, Gram-negative type [Rhodoferax sp.]
MKKTILAVAALNVFGIASAQSSVALYGVIDTSIIVTKANVANGTRIESLSQPGMVSGSFYGSRWGLRVNEELGGGLSAIANIESGFDSTTGASAQGGLLFGRRAVVGLEGGFGSVTVGRNASSFDDVASDHAMMLASIFDPSNTNNGNAAATAGGLNTAANAAAFMDRNSSWVGYSTWFSNSVKYVSPTFGGFSGSAMYAFGEDKKPATASTPAVGASRSISGYLKYVNGPVLVSAGYQSEAFGRTATQKPRLENVMLSGVYDFGPVRFGMGLGRASYKDVAAPVLVGQPLPLAGSFAAQKEWSLSVAVPVGAATYSAGYAQSKGDTLGKSSGLGVQAMYALSKRTTLYAGAQSTKVYDKLASQITSGTMVGYTANASSIGRVTNVGLGIVHNF